MSSRYPIHKDWCHVSHDGPCLREDQPAPRPNAPAAEPLIADEQRQLVEWARETAATRPDGFRTWIAEQVLKFDAALLAARREERLWEARAKALWNHPRTMRPIPAGDDLYYLDSDPNFATTDPWALIDRALAATPEPR